MYRHLTVKRDRKSTEESQRPRLQGQLTTLNMQLAPLLSESRHGPDSQVIKASFEWHGPPSVDKPMIYLGIL